MSTESSRIGFAYRLDAILAVLLLVLVGAGHLCHLEIDLVPTVIIGLILIVAIHMVVRIKVLRPLQRFAEIADNIADGDLTPDQVTAAQDSDLVDLNESFGKIVGTLVEHRGAIEHYMARIDAINKELEVRVASLSILYDASKVMGTTLNIDSLVRSLLQLMAERTQLKQIGFMSYNDRTDTLAIKDLIGFSPELFAKFRLTSGHKLVLSIFDEKGYHQLDDAASDLLVAEFDTDAVRQLKYLMPMRIKDHFVGIMLLGEKLDGTRFSENELQLLRALVGLASMSINNAALFDVSERTKHELDRKVFNLMTLQQSGKVLSSTLDLDKLIQISIDMFLETCWANRGVLMLRSDDHDLLEIKATKGLEVEALQALEKDPAEAWAMTTLEKDRRPILAQELASVSLTQSYSLVNRELPFAVYVPLLKEGELYGVVKIGPKINGEAFSENDLEFFATLSSQAVIAFDNARLYSLAITDSITKLYVNRYFHLRLEEEVRRSQRYNSTLSLLMCDLDHFKLINDTYGHQQGDIILREISTILKRNTRNTDIAARYGGEEFVIILPETTLADAKIVADRIRRDIDCHEFPALVIGQPPLRCTISIGVASFPLNADNKEELISKADSSMYLAKGSGRNRVMLCGVEY